MQLNATRTRDPRVRHVREFVLQGQRVVHTATLYQIVSEHTGQHHHFYLKLETLRRKKATGWEVDTSKSISIDDDKALVRLWSVLTALFVGELPEDPGEYRVFCFPSDGDIPELLSSVMGSADDSLAASLQKILAATSSSAEPVQRLAASLEAAGQAVLDELGSAARLVRYRNARNELAAMIPNEQLHEADFQKFLEQHPWMFGSEYAELLDQRTLTLGNQNDFVLRRTADGFIEFIEIKTPSCGTLFAQDASRHSFYAKSSLSQALGQVRHYIDQFDTERALVNHRDKVDPFKVRGRIIMGRDGDDQQQQALRSLNGSLHRIEVMTFDGLLRVVDQILAMFPRDSAAVSPEPASASLAIEP